MNKKAEHLEVVGEQKERIERIRKVFSDVYDLIDVMCLSSRETSLAITKLEEAQFWAIKGISREPF